MEKNSPLWVRKQTLPGLVLRPSAAPCAPSFLSLHLRPSPRLTRQRLRRPARRESTATQEAPVPPLARYQVPLSASGTNQRLLAIDRLHVDAFQSALHCDQLTDEVGLHGPRCRHVGGAAPSRECDVHQATLLSFTCFLLRHDQL